MSAAIAVQHRDAMIDHVYSAAINDRGLRGARGEKPRNHRRTANKQGIKSMNFRMKTLLAASAATALLASFAGAARAEDAASTVTDAAAAADAAPAAPATWWSTFKLSGHIDVGASLNPSDPAGNINAGQLFTDKANQVYLNSAALTFERDPDTSSKTIDVGFKVQAAYGTDSRYTQPVGQYIDTGSSEQFDFVEAHIDAHIGYGTAGGTELHIGEIPTLEGVEVMDPTGNFFYSKSYLFNYGIPLKFTGILAETHLSPLIDLYYGLDTGVNTTLGDKGGADDGKVHFHGGIGINTAKVTILATTQIGPETYALPNATVAPSGVVYPNGKPMSVNGNRYLNDVVITWKISDKLTSTTDVNYIYDEPSKAGGGGVTEYLAYTLNATTTLGARAEVWGEDQNFYVSNPTGYADYNHAEGGYGSYAPFLYPTGSKPTFAEVTFGVNWKPAGLPKMIDGTTFRPEIRYDTLVSGGKFYDGDTKSDQVTIGFDVVAPLTF